MLIRASQLSSESVADRDERLAEAIVAGDEVACGELYRTYHDALWRWAYRHVRSSQVAEDVVQDVFLRLWQRRSVWIVTGSVRAWLYGAVRNRAFELLRHDRVVKHAHERSGSPETVAGTSTSATLPDSALGEQELRAALASALTELPERRRAVMTVYLGHGLSVQEIARARGTSPEAIRMQMSRARATLAHALASYRPE